VEISPKAAADRGIRNGEYVWMRTPTARAQAEGAGHPEGRARHRVRAVQLRRLVARRGPAALYPSGSAPLVRGESRQHRTTYGYDRWTMMQETDHALPVERA